MTYVNSSVASANASTLLIAAKTRRRRFSIRNDSTATLYLSYGSAASDASLIKIPSGGFYEDPYGSEDDDRMEDPAVYGYWDAANGYARIMEVIR